MKLLIYYTVLCTIAIGLLYFLFSFVGLSFDPHNWDVIGRIVFAIFAACTVILFGVSYDDEKNKQL